MPNPASPGPESFRSPLFSQSILPSLMENPTTKRAPRHFNRHMYDNHPENVFYGTDDGYQDGSFTEFEEIRAHYEGVEAWRREDIHLVSVVGGMYGLNLIPLWKPKRMTIYDINPMAITYFELIRRVWTTSRSADHFLRRLTDADYEAESEAEQFVQENIWLRRRDQLPRTRGSSKRSYEESWTVALDHFDETKRRLLDTPLDIRTEPMESPSFSQWIRDQDNLWIYASNITQFHYFDLDFADPRNCVAVQIIFPQQLHLLDLAPLAGGPVRVHFEIPLAAERLAADVA